MLAVAGWAGPVVALDGQGDTTAADRCEVAVHLMAVVYDHRDPARSIAMVVNGGPPARVVRVGSRVAGLPVLAVLPEALWLGTREDPCWIPLDHQGSQRTAAPKSKAKPKPKKRAPKRKK